MNLSINPYSSSAGPPSSSANDVPLSFLMTDGAISCPSCTGEVVPSGAEWQDCRYCGKELKIYLWPVVRKNTQAASALSDQATCFFHPDKAFQACCQLCGRFVCALCDLQLGAEHVCPTCFERGRADSGAEAGKAELRYRDVLYDSIALTVGWAWIFFWPVIVAAVPTVIVLHVKHRRAPRSYLIPRVGWRFWVAYAGLLWLPLIFIILAVAGRMARRH